MNEPVAPPPTEPRRIFELSELEAYFHEDVARVLTDVAAAELPFVVFETRRSLARQSWLFDHGVTKAHGASGPHPYGLAVDLVLDPLHPSWPARGGRPVTRPGIGAAWDTGIEVVLGSCAVLRPHVVAVWQQLGAIATAHGLEWGGANAGAWASNRRGDLFGWDVSHFQRHHWSQLTSKLPVPT